MRPSTGREALEHSNAVNDRLLPGPADIRSRDAASAPLRIDCGLR